MSARTTSAAWLVFIVAFAGPSVSQDVSEAMEAYGRCSAIVSSGAKPPADAVQVCEKARGTGLPGADFAVGLMLLAKQRSPPPQEALEHLERAARSGNPGAAVVLASFELGSTDPSVRERARRNFRVAYCSGHPWAREAAPRFGLSAEQLSCPNSSLDLSGTWAAKLAWLTSEPGEGTSAPELRVSLAGETVRVEHLTADGWSEVRPGSFTANQLRGTAVIRSIDSGWDLDGEWVESWTIHLHLLDADRATMTLLRSVNNFHMPVTFEWKTFTYLSAGEATRLGK